MAQSDTKERAIWKLKEPALLGEPSQKGRIFEKSRISHHYCGATDPTFGTFTELVY